MRTYDCGPPTGGGSRGASAHVGREYASVCEMPQLRVLALSSAKRAEPTMGCGIEQLYGNAINSPPSRGTCGDSAARGCHARGGGSTWATPAVMVGIGAGFCPQRVSARSFSTRAYSSGESPCLHEHLGMRGHVSPRCHALQRPTSRARFLGVSPPTEEAADDTVSSSGLPSAFLLA